MSVREYVGARYVPLFAEPLQWDNTKTYEPLTIVINQGSSYTSRQYVPAGIDIENTDFWALTGDYNAQVEQYRQEVENIKTEVDQEIENIKTEVDQEIEEVNTEISNIKTFCENKMHAFKNRNVVWVGDSWSVPRTEGSPALPELLSSKMMFNLVENLSVAGTGYIAGGTNTFINRFNTWAESQTADTLASIDYVFAMGSINDQGNTQQSLNTAVSSFVSNVKSKCTNAIVVIVPQFGLFYQNLFTYDTEYGTSKWNTLIEYMDNAGTLYGDICIHGTQWVLCNYGPTVNQDTIHPTQGALQYIVDYLNNYLMGNIKIPTLLLYNNENVLTWFDIVQGEVQSITDYAIKQSITAPNQINLNMRFTVTEGSPNPTYVCFGLPWLYLQGNVSQSYPSIPIKIRDSSFNEYQGYAYAWGQRYSNTSTTTNSTTIANGYMSFNLGACLNKKTITYPIYVEVLGTVV